MRAADAVRAAGPADLTTWDARVVNGPGGHVYQSQAWARHRARFGWAPRFVVLGDGLPVLVLTRPWRLVGGGSAYVSRGPIPEGDPELTATRLVGLTAWLGGQGIDVVAADPEVPADSAYGRHLGDAGFRRIEELQPSRHRMDVALPADGDEAALLKSLSATTRNLVRQAERQGLVVRRLDRHAPAVGPGSDPAARLDVEPAPAPDDSATVDRLYELLVDTARRRGFRLAGRATFRSWTDEALAAGHLFALLVEDPDGRLLAGATFHRHGNRLTYALSGEHEAARRDHPGATRFLLWRAMQIAMAEGRAIMDLGGVDVRGARRRPRPEEPEHGMLTFKESFGATWVELAGAHERVINPLRYAAGRAVTRLLGGGR
ncbi:MAG: peptidoglycan bridge formation glycyltransferase FemA/FemB family protein [Chloroflexi bacterium]|nr:peptidoglycan bridge formation glycyltransferase FemA/FemB family protein [Chloroflexota bacterium]